MRTVPKVLACVDRSHFAEPVADYAAWASARLGAPLELLHVIDRTELGAPISDHSGALGMDTQEHLLSELSQSDEERSRASREAGRLFLNELRTRAIALGHAGPDIRQRHGDLRETLMEQQEQVALFVLGRRGESAEATQRDLGRNVERMVRALRRPILAVTGEFAPPTRVLIAFDGGPVVRQGVEWLAQSPLLRGLPVRLLTVGSSDPRAERALDSAVGTLQKAGFDAEGSIVGGDPENGIMRKVRDDAIDLLVMGAFSHSPLRSLLMGSRTSGLLRAARVPTLLVR